MRLTRRQLRSILLKEAALLSELEVKYHGSGDRRSKGTNAYIEPLHELAKSLPNIPDPAESDDYDSKYDQVSNAIADALEVIIDDIRNSDDNHLAISGLKAVMQYDTFKYSGSPS